MNADDAHKMLDELAMSQEMVDEQTNVLLSPFPTKENAAFFRYQDEVGAAEDVKYIFQHPRGEPLRRSATG